MTSPHVKSWLSGPRWLDLEGDLRRAALAVGLNIQTERTTHGLRQTVYFTASGSEVSLSILTKAIRDFADGRTTK